MHSLNCTVLHLAVEADELEVVEGLLKVGASPDMEIDSGRTALHCAIRKGNLEAVEALIAAGAAINQSGHVYYTPLHKAVAVAVNMSWERSRQGEKIAEPLAQQPGIDFNKKILWD